MEVVLQYVAQFLFSPCQSYLIACGNLVDFQKTPQSFVEMD